MTRTPDEWMIPAEATAELRMRSSKVYSLIRRGLLRAVDVSERPGTGRPRWRIRRSDLEAFLATRQPIPPVTSRRRNAAKPRKDWLA